MVFSMTVPATATSERKDADLRHLPHENHLTFGAVGRLRCRRANSCDSGSGPTRREVSSLRFDEVEVYFASMATGRRPLDRNSRGVGKHILASALWREFLALHNRTGVEHPAGNCQIRIGSEALGRPLLLVGNSAGPCISFTHGHGTMWAAICEESSSCGIDTARPDEFEEDYPFDRAFHGEELGGALLYVGEDRQERAAMLWSAKEAVVKALGCGFHSIDPLDVRMGSFALTEKGLCSLARLARGPTNRPELISVRSFRPRGAWVSVAVVSRQRSS
jgi:hypothetical protein